MKKIIKNIFEKTGYTLNRKGVRSDFVTWAKDVQFEEAAARVKNFTMLERDRLFMLWQFARQAAKLSGSYAQVGVFRGGSARLIAHTKGDKKMYLFDTFQGMPKVNAEFDLHKKGDFKDTSLEKVKELFSGVDNMIFCPGFFPQTSGPANNDKFSFVYIDVDIYQSILDSLNFFYSRTIAGGFIMIDDYMGKNTPGVKKAMDEFLRDKKEIAIITTVGQCVLIKQ